MDPVSQGALGAALPTALARETHRARLGAFAIAGALGGMAPDLDVLIRSREDPLLFLEYHRHFTHALAFIPVGGLIVALALFPLFKRWLGLRTLALATTLGYATHALLDACTTYGTQLFWPFSNVRVAWNNVSVIDPLFTIPLLVLVIAAARKRRPRLAQAGLAWAILYLLVGVVQHERAIVVAEDLATRRGHAPARLDAKPSFGNLLVWKLVYEADGHYYVDAVRIGFGTKLFEGESVPKLDVARDLPWLVEGSVQHDDLERFTWFSDGWVSRTGRGDDGTILVGDVRFSMVPNEVEPLWGIRLDPSTPNEHVRFEEWRDDLKGKQARFLAMFR